MTLPDASPERMPEHVKLRLRAAANQVRNLYPGPAGVVLSGEITAWEEFGYHLGAGTLIMSLVDEVLKAPSRRRMVR